MASQEKNSSRFPFHILDKHDYEESLRGIFAANGTTRLRYKKQKAEVVVVYDKKKVYFNRISKKFNKCTETLYEFFPWLTVIPFLNKKQVEQEDDPNDVDCDALEKKFQQDLKRESESIKNWKRLLFRVQMVRAFSSKSNNNKNQMPIDEEIKPIS